MSSNLVHLSLDRSLTCLALPRRKPDTNMPAAFVAKSSVVPAESYAVLETWTCLDGLKLSADARCVCTVTGSGRQVKKIKR